MNHIDIMNITTKIIYGGSAGGGVAERNITRLRLRSRVMLQLPQLLMLLLPLLLLPQKLIQIENCYSMLILKYLAKIVNVIINN